MKNSAHLAKAIKMQFKWVDVVFKKKKPHTTVQKLQTWFFAALHLCILLSLLGSLYSSVLAQIAALCLQTFATALSVITYALLEEYADKMSSAVELERTQNPLLVASATLRLFSIFHAFLFSSRAIFFLFLLEAMYAVKKCAEIPFFVDATTAWKDVKRLKSDRRICMVYNSLMFIGVILNMSYMLSTPR